METPAKPHHIRGIQEGQLGHREGYFRPVYGPKGGRIKLTLNDPRVTIRVRVKRGAKQGKS